MMARARLAGLDPPGGPGVSIDRIYISWTESWDLDRYVEHYLRERAHEPDEEARAALLGLIALYPGAPPFTKANMDYFLDANCQGAGDPSPRRLRFLVP
jgi:hypothetical protein